MKQLRKATRRTVAALAAALGLGAGLSASAASLTTSGSDEFELRVGSRVTEAKVRGNDIFGSQVQLTNYGSDLRGRAYQAPVNVGWKGGLITGQLGTAPVRLQLRQEGQGVAAEGLIAGQLSDLRIQPASISGRVGRCSYDLRLVGDHYEGSRQCGGKSLPIPTTLELPKGMASMDDAQATALLGVLLSR